MHFSEGIAQRDRIDPARIHRRKVDAASVQEPPAEGDPFRRIVVAADDQHGDLPARQLRQEVVKQPDRLHAGDRTVVDVPGDHDRIRPFAFGCADQAVKDAALLFDHGKLVDALAEVQIGKMEKFHDPRFFRYRTVTQRSESPEAMIASSTRCIFTPSSMVGMYLSGLPWSRSRKHCC